MRQYGSVPPVLSTAQPPAVSGTTGLGTGGGAGVFSGFQPSDGQGVFDVEIFTGGAGANGGSNPGASGSVTLVFPSQPPVLFIAAPDSFGTLSAPNNDGAHTTIVISWTGTLQANKRVRIHCEWSVSQ